MPALHLVARTSALPACLASAGGEDAILLIEDGVYAAITPERLGVTVGMKVYALSEHLAARGLDLERLGPLVIIADFPRFVDLAVLYEQIINWR